MHSSDSIGTHRATLAPGTPHTWRRGAVARTAGTKLEWKSPLTMDDMVRYPDPRLRRPNDTIATFGEDLKRLADEMFDVMYKCAALLQLRALARPRRCFHRPFSVQGVRQRPCSPTTAAPTHACAGIVHARQ